MNENQAFRAVAALARERPQWVPVLQAVLTVAERAEPYGGEFAGAWVLDELGNRSGSQTWLPNLRVLVTYGLLKKRANLFGAAVEPTIGARAPRPLAAL